jgi:heat shock protein HtpX
MFIINPFSGGGIAKLFSTHPSTEDRVARLEAMARGAVRGSKQPILT